ncbi:TonB family protein [Pseudomonas sp. NPDC090755]|uniref:energy transducer TonB n=1 Tax=Pseudomonas sp. NPDC090755 TaxID=3364481 RepID=UPI00383B75A8
MNRLPAYLLLSVALHLSAGWLLHDRQASRESVASLPAMAIQLVSLAPPVQAAPTHSLPARPQSATPAPASPTVPQVARNLPAPPKPAPASKPRAVVDTPPRPAPAPVQPAAAPSAATANTPAVANVAGPNTSSSPLPTSAPSPVLSLRPSFVSPPPPPRYPSQARRRNQQGTVQVEVSLDERGQQLKRTLLRSSGVQSLDQAALEAVAQWRFRPEIVNGRAVPSRVQIPIEFALTANR